MNVSLKHTLNLKLKKVRHFFGNHEFTIMPWINNKHMSSLFLFSFSLCSGVAVDRHWTVLHEHQPWGLYWICQVSYSFPVTIQNIDADVGIYFTYSWVHVPFEVKPRCFVPMCVVCVALSRGSTKWTRRRQLATRYFDHKRTDVFTVKLFLLFPWLQHGAVTLLKSARTHSIHPPEMWHLSFMQPPPFFFSFFPPRLCSGST